MVVRSLRPRGLDGVAAALVQFVSQQARDEAMVTSLVIYGRTLKWFINLPCVICFQDGHEHPACPTLQRSSAEAPKAPHLGQKRTQAGSPAVNVKGPSVQELIKAAVQEALAAQRVEMDELRKQVNDQNIMIRNLLKERFEMDQALGAAGAPPNPIVDVEMVDATPEAVKCASPSAPARAAAVEAKLKIGKSDNKKGGNSTAKAFAKAQSQPQSA